MLPAFLDVSGGRERSRWVCRPKAQQSRFLRQSSLLSKIGKECNREVKKALLVRAKCSLMCSILLKLQNSINNYNFICLQ